MMDHAIKDFAKQFEYQPTIENEGNLTRHAKVVVCGMGGSHLNASVLRDVKEDIDIIIHRDYGLPGIDLADRLIVASSYSGNTEEVIDGLSRALERKLSTAVIAVGGKLLDLARQNHLPYVQLPDTGIQPRCALGFSFLALLKVIGETDLLAQAAGLSTRLQSAELESRGLQLATKWKGKVFVVYSSNRNWSVAYNWKIKLNETGKVPAFHNVLPELNHNEMTGFDVQPSSRALSHNFQFILLKDSDDHPRVQKRMAVLAQQLKARGLPVEEIALTGGTRMERVFSTLPLADWIAFYTAEYYGLESEQVPMVEEFKRLITR